MIVRYGGDLGFRNDFRQCKSQRDVHGYGEDILGNQKVYLEGIDEFMEMKYLCVSV